MIKKCIDADIVLGCKNIIDFDGLVYFFFFGPL